MLGMNVVAADADKGVITVVYWKPTVPPTSKDLDSYLETYTKAGAVATDIKIPRASLGRAVAYTVHAPQPDAVGEAWALVREPWAIVVIVHARTGTPFERTYRNVIGSFALRPL